MSKGGKNSNHPLVSIMTPTWNRRTWFPLAIHCFQNYTYPNLEWCILDDSDEGQTVEDLLPKTPNIKYVRSKERIKLGQKRNMLLEMATGDFLCNQDDDDYYPPERISHAVRTLKANPLYGICGSSRMWIYFLESGPLGNLVSVGPYGPNHATAATWMFRRSFLKDKIKFDPTAEKAEEGQFLQGYSVPLIQLDPYQTILVISHNANTVDKRPMASTPQNFNMAESGMKLRPFLRKDKWAEKFIAERAAEQK